jgi:signal transduction histidine kinase
MTCFTQEQSSARGFSLLYHFVCWPIAEWAHAAVFLQYHGKIMPLVFNLSTLAQLVFTFCVIAVLEGIAVYTWQFNAERGARWHVAAQSCKCLWLAAIALGSLGVDGLWGTSCGMATWLLAMASVYIWFRFFLEISGYDREAPRWLEPVVRLGVLGSWLLYLSDPWLHLILVPAGAAGPAHFGRLCYLTYPFGYAVNSFTVGINVRWALRCPGLRRRQALAFLLPNLMIWTGQFLSAMRWFGSYDPHALFFLLSGVATAWAFFRWRAYSVLPLAQEAMLCNMVDGLMVIDEEGYIVRMNNAMQSIFPDTAKEGIRFDSIARLCPELQQMRAASESQAREAHWLVGKKTRVFQVQTSPLYAATGFLLGQVFCFKDITQEKEQQACIIAQEKAISQLEERARMGRELHDNHGQLWSYLSMQIYTIEKKMEQGRSGRALELMRQLQKVVQEKHVGVREMINALYADNTLSRGLLIAIEEQIHWYRENCGWHIHLDLRCAWREDLFSQKTNAQLLRIVQESLSNVRKHAQAERVLIAIDRQGDLMRFLVEDNGSGFDVDYVRKIPGHHGLRMMWERADAIGAELQIESNTDKGTSLVISVPVLCGEYATAGATAVEDIS